MATGVSGTSEELPLEDIVLLQLFKDNLLGGPLEPSRSPSSDLSDLESVLSPDCKAEPGGWAGPAPSPALPRDLPPPRRPARQDSQARKIGKDEKLAKDARLPFTVKTLVSLPMDEFNDLLSKNDLTEEQLNICRDIR